LQGDWSSDVCSSDLGRLPATGIHFGGATGDLRRREMYRYSDLAELHVPGRWFCSVAVLPVQRVRKANPVRRDRAVWAASRLPVNFPQNCKQQTLAPDSCRDGLRWRATEPFRADCADARPAYAAL